MITTPSAVIRRSLRAQSRSLIGSGSDDARMSKRRCTALDTLLTFCPPAPCARTAVHSISSGLIAVTGRVVLRVSSRDCVPPTERLVQRDELRPRALGLRFVVERRAILYRHVGHAPAVPCGIDLDFHGNARLRKTLLQ